MKTLLLMRHAKSSWKDPTQTDRERPLNKRGRKTAPLMGKWLSRQELLPDVLLCSPAQRARETAEALMDGGGFHPPLIVSEELYPTTVAGCVEALGCIEDVFSRLLLIGHNPGLEQLTALWAGEFHRLPTAAVVHFEVPVDSWSEVTSRQTARLMQIGYPRELFDV